MYSNCDINSKVSWFNFVAAMQSSFPHTYHVFCGFNYIDSLNIEPPRKIRRIRHIAALNGGTQTLQSNYSYTATYLHVPEYIHVKNQSNKLRQWYHRSSLN